MNQFLILWRWYCVVKNKSKCGFSSYVLLSITNTRHYSFPKHFFELFLHTSEFAKVFERKVWRVQAAHLHNAARALSNPSRCFQLSRQGFLWYCGKKQIECGLAWCIVLSTTIRVDKTRALIRRAVKRAGPSKKVWCSRLGSTKTRRFYLLTLELWFLKKFHETPSMWASNLFGAYFVLRQSQRGSFSGMKTVL